MPAFALVHSPLVGPATWAPVAEVLVADGHDVVVPSLVPVAAGSTSFTSAAVEAVVAATVGGYAPLAVVGHSGAGPLLPAIGEALQDRVACYLFVDAALPSPGRTRLADLHPLLQGHLADLVDGDGLLAPWHEWWEPGTFEGLVPDPALRADVMAELRPARFAFFEEVLPDRRRLIDDRSTGPHGSAR